MTNISREAVRALTLDNDPDAALQAVAQALDLPAETVAECVLEVVA